MTISWTWLKEYIEVENELSIDEVSSILTSIGLEVEHIDKYESIKGGLDKFYIGEVISCTKHPNADKLSLTEVNLGTELGIKKIVCGAPNVAQGQKVVVATEGAMIYLPSGESFAIKNSKIRGEDSQGMICAEDELGIGDSHAGILVLDEIANPGTPASSYFKLNSDEILEIGLTPNRTDAMCHYGVARDLVAALLARGVSAKLKNPNPTKSLIQSQLNQKVDIKLNTDLGPKFHGVIIEGVGTSPSPEWMQNKLKSIGENPKNILVDITNYLLHDLGQPLHAYDLTKIDSAEITVSVLNDKTTFKALNGLNLELEPNDIVISDKSKIIGIAGIMGGENSAISNSTTSIFLEAAYFDGTQIRKTSQRLGLRSESSAKFEKGIDPEGAMLALEKAIQLLAEIFPKLKISPIFCNSIKEFEPFNVRMRKEKLYQYANDVIADDTVEAIVSSLGIRIISSDEKEWEMAVPRFKSDVTREEDLIEEVLRIYGYNRLPYPKHMRSSLSFMRGLTIHQFEEKLSNCLVGIGLNEIITNSISQSKYYPDESPIKLLNSMTSELDCMRTSIVPNILEVVEYNLNRDLKDLAFFEIGNEYMLENNTYSQKKKLAIVLTGNSEVTSWENAKGVKTDFYKIKKIAELIQDTFGYSFDFQELESADYHYGLGIFMHKKCIGAIGEIKIDTKLFDIKQSVFGLELDIQNLFEYSSKKKVLYKEATKFPVVKRDLALILDTQIVFSEIEILFRKALGSTLVDIKLFDIYKGTSLGENKKSYAVRVTMQNEEKTMTDREIEGLMSKLISESKSKLKAEIRV